MECRMRIRYAMSGRAIGTGGRVCNVREGDRCIGSGPELGTQGVCCYAMSGTGTAYHATRYPVLTERIMLRDVRYRHSVCCYAVLGHTLGYHARQCRVLTSAMLLRDVRY
eukprot:3054528-Rhodomonas_salina.1